MDLHQTDGAGTGDGKGVEIGLRVDNGHQQAGVEFKAACIFRYQGKHPFGSDFHVIRNHV